MIASLLIFILILNFILLHILNVNSPLKDSSKNLKVYHQNTRGLKGKISQLSKYIIFTMNNSASPYGFGNRYEVN